MQKQAEEIAKEFATVRADTHALFDLVGREEDLHVSPGFGYRPLIWHLAHIGVFESYWILQRVKGEASPDERYERIFDPIRTPRENSVQLPTRREMESYLARVRESVENYLGTVRFNEGQDRLLRDGYIFQLVLEHERQHQETLLYLLHLLDPSKKRQPDLLQAIPQPKEREAQASRVIHSSAKPEMITIPGGEFEMGAHRSSSFAYDNELPLQTLVVPSFKIDRLPTTNREYAGFIEEGGYERRQFWSEDGWAWREREGWSAPLYWTRNGKVWHERTMFVEDLMSPDHPVVGISWYEADAYARFKGKRLPTEAEWEKAASWDAARERKRLFAWGDDTPTSAFCNFNNYFGGTTAVGSFADGASEDGCLDMTGNVWEWTSDEFKGYEGFTAFPYPEYSEAWFDSDHRVLKGGSWATRASILRTSFRNFFRRHFRIAFAGLRCAADA